MMHIGIVVILFSFWLIILNGQFFIDICLQYDLFMCFHLFLALKSNYSCEQVGGSGTAVEFSQ